MMRLAKDRKDWLIREVYYTQHWVHMAELIDIEVKVLVDTGLDGVESWSL